MIVSPREREAIARHLGMSVAAFEAAHTTVSGDDVVLRDVESGACEWLDRLPGGTTACRVNAAKPDQCASYPFWPRVVASPEAWEDEKTRCKGIGGDIVVSAGEIDERSGMADALADLDLLLEELDYEVKDLGARCWLSGDCCDFDAAGHRLFTSEIEARRFAKGVDLTGWDPASRMCPAWKDRRCTAREHRPLACRTYFCDPAFTERVNDLTECYITRLKWLHEKHRLNWDYRDFLAHLARLKESLPVVSRANDRYQGDARADVNVTGS